MTNEERLALIGLCRIEIKRWKSITDKQRGDFMVELMEIALASLQAEIHSYTFEDDPQPLYTSPPAPAIPDGWKLVPVEPTDEMFNAWDGAPCNNEDDTENMLSAYRAMIAAAPTP